jgi:[protein-PII] uridylyltransferase
MQNEIGRLRRKFRDGRAELFRSDARTAPCRELLEQHVALVDGIVDEIYKASCRAADKECAKTRHSGLAILATGGYGRKELNPFSDVDIAFVPSEEEDPWVEAAVHMAFRLVMDVFLSFREVRVGYSYRPVSEVSTWDLATKTALLDTRHLCGDRYLSEALDFQLRQNLSPLDLTLEFYSEAGPEGRGRANSLYSVEPNLKQGPGSLRDLHRGRWIYKLLLGVDDASLPATLERKGYLSASRIAAVQSAAEWFWQARNWLHLVTGKRTDVLVNNYQDRIAREWSAASAQEWLSRHYGHAETLASFRESALRHVLEGPLDLGGIRLAGGYLHLEKKEIDKVPVAKLFHLSQRYSIPVSLEDLKSLEEYSSAGPGENEPSPEESWAFLNILGEGRDVARSLRYMCSFGYLDRFIPGFSEVMRFVPPDPAHRYTVGEHSLKIIEHLEEVKHRRDASGPHFSELLDQCSHFDVLCLAALLHDAGKLQRGDNHSEAGARLAAEAASRLELPPDKRELLEILVRHHLLLVRTSRLQDLKSAGVIQNVADKIPSVEALRHLYVFTYVDTRAVAERNWTSMDFHDLQELYQKVQSYLSGPSQAGAEAVEDKIVQVRRKLAASHQPHQEEGIRKHCDSMPASYVLNTPLDEIAFHIQLLSRLEEEKVVLDIYNRPGDDFSELTVCTYDDPQPGLLAKITGVLYGCNADIQKAQVFTMESARPIVLDTLWLRSAGMQVSENRAHRVRSALKEVLTGSRSVEQFLKAGGKHPPSGVLLESVELRNDLSEEHTVVHVIARDLQGLLYLMTRALSRSGLHIHSAKVATWAARAENNFYVTTLTGGQIPDDELSEWKEHLSRMFRGISAE